MTFLTLAGKCGAAAASSPRSDASAAMPSPADVRWRKRRRSNRWLRRMNSSLIIMPYLCTLPENLGPRFAEICALQRVYYYAMAPEHSFVIVEEVDHSITGNIHSVQRQLRLEFRFGELRIGNRLEGAVFLCLVVFVPAVVVGLSQVSGCYPL